MANHEPWSRAFTTMPSRAERFVSDMLSRLPVFPAKKKRDVLDLGCGTGAPAFQLATICSNAHITGIDISGASIVAAERACRQLPHSERLRFLAQDYMESNLRPFDLIYSDSCLHLIPQANEMLFAKLAHDLKPGGHLVFSIPRQCGYNFGLTMARRCFRLIRSRATDLVFSKLAQLVYGGTLSADFLNERVHYMYVIPHRFGNALLAEHLDRQFDLQCQGVYPYAHASIAQYKHRLWVFQKRKPEGGLKAAE